MKKRVFLILFMFLTTLVLAGCDWFGQKITTTTTGSETTEAQTTTVTTQAPTTTEITTAPVTTVTTVTTVPNNFTISFEENGGSAVTNITQVSGTAVTAPVPPTKTGYTFVGWYSNTELTTAYTFTTMPSSNITVYAKWQIITYTVDFYDDDETLIVSQTVGYGQGATAPTAPYKAGERFVGWDTAFNNVTGNLVITAVYEEHYEALVLMVLSIGGDEMTTEEVDEMIEMLMFVSGMETEEETYLMMVDVMALVNEIPTITSLTEFQAWFASLSTEGFDRDTMVQMLVQAVLVFIDKEANSYDEQEFLDYIDYLEGELAYYSGELLDAQNAASDYCLTLPGPAQSVCQNYIDAVYERNELENEYREALYPSKGQSWEDFEWELYYDMEWALSEYYFYYYEVEDFVQADYYQDEYDTMYNSLSTYELSIYGPILNLYDVFMNYRYTVYNPLEEMVFQIQDPNREYRQVGEILQSDYMPAFWDAYYSVQSAEWMLFEQQQWMEEKAAEHELLMQIRDYLWTVDGKAKLTIFAGTAYDVVASVIVGIDPATFELIFGLVTGSIDPETIPLTPTDISGYAHQVADLLTLLSSTLDAADATNIISLANDLIGIYIGSTDMPIEQQTLILQLINVKGPQYFGILSDVYGEVINILNSMTPEKVQAIMDFFMNMNQIETKRTESEMDRLGMVIQVAQLVDILLYDGSVNTDMLVSHFITVYFDITTMFNADPQLVQLVQIAMMDAVDQMIALSHEVALIDPDNASVDDMLKVYELYKRGERLVMIFESGDLPSILEPYDYLEARQMMLNIIDPYQDMDLEQANELIDVIMYTFDMDSEAEVLFTILQVMELPQYLQMITSVEDVQELYLMIGEMGFDNETIAGMAARFLESFSHYMAYYEYDPAEYDYYYNLYLLAQAEYDGYVQQLTDLMDAFNDEIAIMPEPQKTDIINQWDVFLYNRDLENDFWNNYNFYSYDVYYWDWNSNDYWYLDDILNRYYQTIGGNMLPPEMQVNNYQIFLDALAQFSPDEQYMYMTVLNYADYNYWYHWMVYMPGFINIQQSYNMVQVTTGKPVPMWFIDTINAYNDLNYQIGEAQRSLDEYRWSMEDAQEGMAWVYIDEFFDDTENLGLVEDVALILLDEVESLIMYEDTDMYNLVIGLISGSVDPSTLDLSPAGILALVNMGEDFLVHLFSSMDETDKVTVMTLTGKVLGYYLSTLDLTPEEYDALYLMYSEKLSFYFYGLFDAKDILTDFMATLTVEKIETIMNAINIISSLPNEYLEGEEAQELNDNLVRGIYISIIVDTLLSGDTLDTDYLINLVINGYFDFSYGFLYDGEVVIDDVVLNLQTLITDIIDQAGVVEGYYVHINELMIISYDDPATLEITEGITQAELDQIDALRILIEDLMYFLDKGPEQAYIPIVE